MSKNGSESWKMVKWTNMFIIAPADPVGLQSKTEVNAKKKNEGTVFGKLASHKSRLIRCVGVVHEDCS
jgi:hypothetical protein